jgi:hypothetical protein
MRELDVPGGDRCVLQRLQREDDPIGAGVNPKVPVGVVTARRNSGRSYLDRPSQ